MTFKITAHKDRSSGPIGTIITLSDEDLERIRSRMIPNTLEEAYQKLGLVQLDQFVLDAVAANRRRPGAYTIDPDVVYRQIGASTWMTVRAALSILSGHSTCIFGRTLRDAARLASMVDGHLRLLHPGIGSETVTRTDSRIHYHDFATLRWEPAPTNRTPDTQDLMSRDRLRGVVFFDDDEWKERTIRLTKGPDAMTQEIRLEEGHYYGYDEDGERLLELAEEGVITLVREKRPRPVRCSGFVVKPPPAPDANRVANIFCDHTPPPENLKGIIVPVPVSRILDLTGGNATRGYASYPGTGFKSKKRR